MSLFDKLNEKEIEMMRAYISNYAGENAETLSYSSDSMNMRHILRFWNESKQSLYKMFGEKFVITSPISYQKPQYELQDELYARIFDCDAPGNAFYKAFLNFADQYWDDERPLFHNLVSLVHTDTLLANSVLADSFSFTLPNGKKLDVNTGSKASKMLGKIAKELNLKGYEEFRIAHSMCLNQKSANGTICLSIHPLDYMTMSDNDSGWSSCMSWKECGDYRQGTVEMMNSPRVVVAYLKSNTDMDLCATESYHWNNKKWRELFIVDEDIIMGIKQYPYNNDILHSWCLNKLRELAMNCGEFGNYAPQMYKVRNNMRTNVTHLDRRIIFNFSTNFMYNDVYSDHDAYISTPDGDSVEINYSGATECMYCGEEIFENADDLPTSSLLCTHHAHYIHCEECGAHMSEDDNFFWVDDTRICECCYDNYTSTCDFCGETHFESNMVKVYLRGPKGEYLTWYRITVCDWCLDNNSRFREEIGKAEWDNEAFRYYINITDLKPDGIDFFDVSEDDITFYLGEENNCSE